jgi:hypothetical protein
MITKELENTKMCLFCASDYHLEMILLPYIKEKINTSQFIILSQNNLEPTIKILLDKVNIDEESKKKIWNLNWKETAINKIENFKMNEQEINIIINGELEYIKIVNNYLRKNINKKINIIDCFHVDDTNVNIDEISQKYKYILNTNKI